MIPRMRVVRNLVLTLASILWVATPSLAVAPATGAKAVNQDAKAVGQPGAKPGVKAPAVKGKPSKPLTKRQQARVAALQAKRDAKKAEKLAARQAQLAEKRAAKNPKAGAGKAKAQPGTGARSKKAVE
jgi:hypothetical protein